MEAPLSTSILSWAMETSGGYAPAALLLLRMRYWMPKARIKRGGKLWVAKTREEWARECGCSPKQIERALMRLYGAEILERRWGRWGVKTITLLRISDKVQLNCTATPPASGTEEESLSRGNIPYHTRPEGRATPLVEQPATPSLVQPAAPVPVQPKEPLSYTQRDTNKERQLSSPAGFGRENFKIPRKENFLGDSETKEDFAEPRGGDLTVKVQDVFNQIPEAPTESEVLDSAKGAINVTDLLRVWRDGQRASKPKQMIPHLPPQGKAGGHIKTLRKALGDESVGTVLALVAARWASFRAYLEDEAQWKSQLPAQANLGVLVVALEHVGGWLAAELKPAEPEVSEPTGPDFLDGLV